MCVYAVLTMMMMFVEGVQRGLSLKVLLLLMMMRKQGMQQRDTVLMTESGKGKEYWLRLML